MLSFELFYGAKEPTYVHVEPWWIFVRDILFWCLRSSGKPIPAGPMLLLSNEISFV
jgi:hypothetical protein